MSSSKGWTCDKRIDDAGDVLRAVLPSAGIAEGCARCNGSRNRQRVAVRRMNAYVSVTGPYCPGRSESLDANSTVREDDDTETADRSWI